MPLPWLNGSWLYHPDEVRSIFGLKTGKSEGSQDGTKGRSSFCVTVKILLCGTKGSAHAGQGKANTLGDMVMLEMTLQTLDRPYQQRCSAIWRTHKAFVVTCSQLLPDHFFRQSGILESTLINLTPLCHTTSDVSQQHSSFLKTTSQSQQRICFRSTDHQPRNCAKNQGVNCKLQHCNTATKTATTKQRTNERTNERTKPTQNIKTLFIAQHETTTNQPSTVANSRAHTAPQSLTPLLLSFLFLSVFTVSHCQSISQSVTLPASHSRIHSHTHFSFPYFPSTR